jgi:hypothetical protein
VLVTIQRIADILAHIGSERLACSTGWPVLPN